MLGQTGEESSDLIDGRIAERFKTSTWKLSAPFQIGLRESSVLLKNGLQDTKSDLNGLGITMQKVGGQLGVDRPHTVELVHSDVEDVFPVACIPEYLEPWSLNVGLQCLGASFLGYSCINVGGKVRNWHIPHSY